MNVRRDRSARNLRGVHDADVARALLAGDARFLRALHQAVVDLAVALGFALQNAVLDALAVLAERFGFLRVQRGLQAPFLVQRGEIFVLDRLDDLRLFDMQLGVGALDGRADLDHFLVTRTVSFGKLLLLPLQVRQVGFQLLHVVVGEDSRKGIERARALDGLELVVQRFLVDPFGFGLGQRRVQIGQALHDDVGRGVGDRHGAVLFLVVLEGRLAGFRRSLLLGQPLGQPVRRVLRRAELELHVLLDVGLGHGVGRRGRKRGVGGCVTDFHDAAVADRKDRQAAQERVDPCRLRRRLIDGGPLLDR